MFETIFKSSESFIESMNIRGLQWVQLYNKGLLYRMNGTDFFFFSNYDSNDHERSILLKSSITGECHVLFSGTDAEEIHKVLSSTGKIKCTWVHDFSEQKVMSCNMYKFYKELIKTESFYKDRVFGKTTYVFNNGYTISVADDLTKSDLCSLSKDERSLVFDIIRTKDETSF